MYATHRRYEGIDQSRIEELTTKVNDGLIPRLSKLPGSRATSFSRPATASSSRPPCSTPRATLRTRLASRPSGRRRRSSRSWLRMRPRSLPGRCSRTRRRRPRSSELRLERRPALAVLLGRTDYHRRPPRARLARKRTTVHPASATVAIEAPTRNVIICPSAAARDRSASGSRDRSARRRG